MGLDYLATNPPSSCSSVLYGSTLGFPEHVPKNYSEHLQPPATARSLLVLLSQQAYGHEVQIGMEEARSFMTVSDFRAFYYASMEFWKYGFLCF